MKAQPKTDVESSSWIDAVIGMKISLMPVVIHFAK